MVVSEVRGGKVSDLFQVFTVSDGNAANYQVKITLLNIDLDTGEFDILVRDFNDSDDNMVVLEKFTRCTMNSSLPGYVGRKVGTQDGEYELRSKYIMLVMSDEHPEDAIPAGFKGFVADNLASSTSVLGAVRYKTQFFEAGDETGSFSLTGEPTLSAQGDKPKKVSLGLSALKICSSLTSATTGTSLGAKVMVSFFSFPTTTFSERSFNDFSDWNSSTNNLY